jgi:hypothetical protein
MGTGCIALRAHLVPSLTLYLSRYQAADLCPLPNPAAGPRLLSAFAIPYHDVIYPHPERERRVGQQTLHIHARGRSSSLFTTPIWGMAYANPNAVSLIALRYLTTSRSRDREGKPI